MIGQILDKQDFIELAYHILKGDQLIVRGNDVSTVTSIISVLKVPSSSYKISISMCIVYNNNIGSGPSLLLQYHQFQLLLQGTIRVQLPGSVCGGRAASSRGSLRTPRASRYPSSSKTPLLQTQ